MSESIRNARVLDTTRPLTIGNAQNGNNPDTMSALPIVRDNAKWAIIDEYVIKCHQTHEKGRFAMSTSNLDKVIYSLQSGTPIPDDVTLPRHGKDATSSEWQTMAGRSRQVSSFLGQLGVGIADAGSSSRGNVGSIHDNHRHPIVVLPDDDVDDDDSNDCERTVTRFPRMVALSFGKERNNRVIGHDIVTSFSSSGTNVLPDDRNDISAKTGAYVHGSDEYHRDVYTGAVFLLCDRQGVTLQQYAQHFGGKDWLRQFHDDIAVMYGPVPVSISHGATLWSEGLDGCMRHLFKLCKDGASLCDVFGEPVMRWIGGCPDVYVMAAINDLPMAYSMQARCFGLGVVQWFCVTQDWHQDHAIEKVGFLHRRYSIADVEGIVRYR